MPCQGEGQLADVVAELLEVEVAGVASEFDHRQTTEAAVLCVRDEHAAQFRLLAGKPLNTGVWRHRHVLAELDGAAGKRFAVVGRVVDPEELDSLHLGASHQGGDITRIELVVPRQVEVATG